MRIADCDRCGRPAVWVNTVAVKGCRVGEWCGDCFERHLGVGARRRPRSGRPGPKEDGGAWGENAVRELEDAAQ